MLYKEIKNATGKKIYDDVIYPTYANRHCLDVHSAILNHMEFLISQVLHYYDYDARGLGWMKGQFLFLARLITRFFLCAFQ